MEPFFSVIIPTYNRRQYIEETIESVLKQTYPNFEIIIVDDGSTDGTETVVHSRFTKHPQIRYFYKKNEERAVARNFGLGKALGRYAVFFDSDDLMLPEYLDDLYYAISKYSPDLVATKYKFFDSETKKQWPSSMQNIKEGWYGLNSFLNGNMLACNYAVRTSAAFRLFPPARDLASMEDWLFLLQNLTDKKIYIIEKEGVLMREHAGRSVANNRLIISARKNATEWALDNISLTPFQQKELRTYTEYFCGIHEYLDGRRLSAIKQGLKAIQNGGIKKDFILLCLKSFIGRRWIERLK